MSEYTLLKSTKNGRLLAITRYSIEKDRFYWDKVTTHPVFNERAACLLMASRGNVFVLPVGSTTMEMY